MQSPITPCHRAPGRTTAHQSRAPSCAAHHHDVERRRQVRQRSQARTHATAGATENSTLTSRMVTLGDADFELISTPAQTEHPPLLFLHGAGHGAWCWAEHFMPWLAERGLECHALSFRGHGKSAGVPEGEKAAGTLASHANDIAALIATMRAPPVAVGHSFGGLILQRYLYDAACGESGFQKLPGAVFVASGGPNGADTMRFVLRAPIASAKAIWALIRKSYATDLGSLRDAFFHAGTPAEELERIRPIIAEQLPASTLVDLSKMRVRAGESPSKSDFVPGVISLNRRSIVVRNVDGMATWRGGNVCNALHASKKEELPVPRVPSEHVPPALVLGACEDTIVDAQDCSEVAACFSTQAMMIGGSGHDAMLDVKWEDFATEIASFVKTLR